jgi:hypothetical protein
LGGRLDQAEDLAGALVEPVAEIAHAILLLDLEVLLVRQLAYLGGEAVDPVVDIHVEGHPLPPR